MRDMLIKFQQIDRRLIFVGMAVAILIPMMLPLSLPVDADPELKAVYDEVERLDDRSTVMISADFDPSSKPELGPFFQANLHHLFRKNVKVVVLTLWPSSPALVIPYLEKISAEYGRVYGRDWVFLGFKDGKELAIKAIGDNIPQTFPTDYKGNSLNDLPIMAGIKQAKDFDLIISVSAGSPGMSEYLSQIQTQYDLRMVGACTAVSGPEHLPFFAKDGTGQLKGLSAGMPGSAQYENLVWDEEREEWPLPEGTEKLGNAGLNVLNVGHLFIILLIVLGNIAFFLTKNDKEDAA